KLAISFYSTRLHGWSSGSRNSKRGCWLINCYTNCNHLTYTKETHNGKLRRAHCSAESANESSTRRGSGAKGTGTSYSSCAFNPNSQSLSHARRIVRRHARYRLE